VSAVTAGWSFSIRDTVPTPTPARAATSLTVGDRPAFAVVCWVRPPGLRGTGSMETLPPLAVKA